jgi:EAL domain-containing protein (putative c-di-GMP-specific phosphodiesterase class I)
VAEGIERQDQLDILRGLACELGQGNHLARPMREAALIEAMVDRGDERIRRGTTSPVTAPVPGLAPLR